MLKIRHFLLMFSSYFKILSYSARSDDKNESARFSGKGAVCAGLASAKISVDTFRPLSCGPPILRLQKKQSLCFKGREAKGGKGNKKVNTGQNATEDCLGDWQFSGHFLQKFTANTCPRSCKIKPGSTGNVAYLRCSPHVFKSVHWSKSLRPHCS